MPELFVLNGVAAGTVFPLGDVPAVIGRSPEAHLQIGDPWISSMHAMFERRGDGVWVVDLESRNGTFIGDDRVGEAPVPDGAVVRLGRTEVRFSVRHETGAEVEVELPRETPVTAIARRETVRTDASMTTHLPLAREPQAEREVDAEARGIGLRPATVLRMAIDAAGLEAVSGAQERLQGALDACARAALEGGGVVGRLAGVGILAVFGLTGADTDDSSRALRVARIARRAVQAERGLDLRAGIETGPVLAGNAAGTTGFELAALGPAAERAERLVALAGRGEILAGPGAARAAAGLGGLARMGLVRIGQVEIEVFMDAG